MRVAERRPSVTYRPHTPGDWHTIVGITEGSPSAERRAEGLWIIRFPTIESVTAELCQPLVGPLIADSKAGPIVLLGHLPLALRLVPAGMAPFWLNAFLLKGLRVKAIGVTATSRAVRVVVAGIEAAMRLRENPIKVQTLATLEELIAWGHLQLKP